MTSAAPSEPRMVAPWELRVTTLLPGSPLVSGAILFGLLAGFYLVTRWLMGVPWWLPGRYSDFPLTSSGRMSIILSLLVAYLVAGGSHLSVSHTRDLRRMGVLPPPGDSEADVSATIRVPIRDLRRSRVAGHAALLLGLAFIFWIHQLIGDSFLDNVRKFSEAYLIGLALLSFWLVGRAAYATLNAWTALGLAQVRVDLMSLRELRPLGRMALRSALAWIVGTSILSLLFLTPEFTLAQLVFAIGPMLLVTFVIAVLALLLPFRGLQQRIRERKDEEVSRVDAELARLREPALTGDAVSQERLAGLLAYRSHVEGLPEWPLDPSVRTRFVLYLLIPLGSWFGGAFVERFVSALMD